MSPGQSETYCLERDVRRHCQGAGKKKLCDSNTIKGEKKKNYRYNQSIRSGSASSPEPSKKQTFYSFLTC